MFTWYAIREIFKVLQYNNSKVSQCIDMSCDVKDLRDNRKTSFSNQIDEPTEFIICNIYKITLYIYRFYKIWKWWNQENFFLLQSAAQSQQRTGYLMFCPLSRNKRSILEELCWHLCWKCPINSWLHVKMCHYCLNSPHTSKKKPKKQKPDFSTQCFLHRELLVSKALEDEMKKFYLKLQKMIDFIKQKPVYSKMFKELCENLDKEHINLLLHAEVQELSRWRVLNRTSEPNGELQGYVRKHSRPDSAKCSEDEEWLLKLANLAKICYHMKQMNHSLQDLKESILTSSDKILGEKIKWQKDIKRCSYCCLDLRVKKDISANLKSCWPRGTKFKNKIEQKKNRTVFSLCFQTSVTLKWEILSLNHLCRLRTWLWGERILCTAVWLWNQDGIYWSAPKKCWISIKE